MKIGLKSWSVHRLNLQRRPPPVRSNVCGPTIVYSIEDSRRAEDDFRCPIKSGLDVGIDALMLVAGRAEVYDLDSAMSWLLQQDVFRLQVAVNQLVFA